MKKVHCQYIKIEYVPSLQTFSKHRCIKNDEVVAPCTTVSTRTILFHDYKVVNLGQFEISAFIIVSIIR